jgi:DHA1 family bicyclomycin/chloramphenicol resistance-like MFS transporter
MSPTPIMAVPRRRRGGDYANGDRDPGSAGRRVTDASRMIDHTSLPGACEARYGWRVLAILSTLMGFASISTDLFLPAIPTIARALRAEVGTVELTISSYLIGFSLGQLVWGPISDRHGRR